MRAKVAITSRDIDHDIVYLKDMSPQLGGRTITNDAENVVDYCRSLYGNRVRVVYTDTNDELWELAWSLELDAGTVVTFKPWYGLVWDKLSHV